MMDRRHTAEGNERENKKEMFSIYRPFITRPYKNAETRRQK